jgi:hypothetical protein
VALKTDVSTTSLNRHYQSPDTSQHIMSRIYIFPDRLLSDWAASGDSDKTLMLLRNVSFFRAENEGSKFFPKRWYFPTSLCFVKTPNINNNNNTVVTMGTSYLTQVTTRIFDRHTPCTCLRGSNLYDILSRNMRWIIQCPSSYSQLNLWNSIFTDN